MTSLLLFAVITAPPENPTICLTQLWEVYDYDYDHDDHGGYAELVVWAWTVEIKHDLDRGMTGWRYLGFIQLSRLLRYDTEDDENVAWWSSESGRNGTAPTTEGAVDAILNAQNIRGKPDIRYR